MDIKNKLTVPGGAAGGRMTGKEGEVSRNMYKDTWTKTTGGWRSEA